MNAKELAESAKDVADTLAAKYLPFGEQVLGMIAPHLAGDPVVQTAEEILAAIIAAARAIFGSAPATTPAQVAAEGEKLVDGLAKNLADAQAAEDEKFGPALSAQPAEAPSLDRIGATADGQK